MTPLIKHAICMWEAARALNLELIQQYQMADEAERSRISKAQDLACDEMCSAEWLIYSIEATSLEDCVAIELFDHAVACEEIRVLTQGPTRNFNLLGGELVPILVPSDRVMSPASA
jgi:hypothetical protein